jgi:hypothetical protein
VAFPPNYRQERSNRERTKQRKALEKQARRDEKSAARKDEGVNDAAVPSEPMAPKES